MDFISFIISTHFNLAIFIETVAWNESATLHETNNYKPNFSAFSYKTTKLSCNSCYQPYRNQHIPKLQNMKPKFQKTISIESEEPGLIPWIRQILKAASLSLSQMAALFLHSEVLIPSAETSHICSDGFTNMYSR